MQSTLAYAVDLLATFGVDVDPLNCDAGACRADAADIRAGRTPLHLSECPPPFAADLLDTVADALDRR